jgi:hypothetical protein
VNIQDLSLIRVAEQADKPPVPMLEQRRIQLGQAVAVTALVFLAAFVATLMVTAEPTPRPATHQPAGEVGSGLHLPLGGGR